MARILIVEDDLSTQRLFKSQLEYLGYKIIGLANNGLEAIKIYENYSKKIDLILMDYQMPIMDGLEALEILLEKDYNLKIILTSGNKNIEDIVLGCGAIAFIEKPFGICILDNIIKNVLSNEKKFHINEERTFFMTE